MEYEEAIATNVSVFEAINELKSHGVTAVFDGKYIVCKLSGERIAKASKDEEVKGATILNWLGY